jgi:hypothetical protein
MLHSRRNQAKFQVACEVVYDRPKTSHKVKHKSPIPIFILNR